jgi:hypothetical protein
VPVEPRPVLLPPPVAAAPPAQPVPVLSGPAAAALARTRETVFSAGPGHSSEEKPVYILAMIELKEAGRPLRYADISARLAAKGYRFGPDSVMGSLSGFYSTPRGKSLLNRVGKGEYELRTNYEGEGAVVQNPAGGTAPAVALQSPAQTPQMAHVAAVTPPTFQGSQRLTGSNPLASMGNTNPSSPSAASKFVPVDVSEDGKRRPFLYETAYEVLREDGSAMYYKDIAARINAQGIPTTGDQVLGALGGWYAHAGADYLERTGPGRYRARPGKLFVPAQGTREINAVMIVNPTVSPDPSSNVQIGQASFNRSFLHEMSLSKAPFYQLAHEILREAKVPMHYREIASVLKASGRNVHQDTIMGSLNGYINTTAGKAQLQRVGKGIYTLCEFVHKDQRSAASVLAQQQLSLAPPRLRIEDNVPPPPPFQRQQPLRPAAIPPMVVSALMPPPTPPMMMAPAGFREELLQGQRKRSRSSEDEDALVEEEAGEEATAVLSELEGVRVRRSAAAQEAVAMELEENEEDEENEKLDDEEVQEEEDEENLENDEELPVVEHVMARPASFGHNNPVLKRSRDEMPETTPTFLDVYYLFKEKVPGHAAGLTLKDMSDLLAQRGCLITTQRLNSRLSAYTSYRRKKNLPQLFDRKQGKFTLSVYGRKVMSDHFIEADFLRSVFSRGK